MPLSTDWESCSSRAYRPAYIQTGKQSQRARPWTIVPLPLAVPSTLTWDEGQSDGNLLAQWGCSCHACMLVRVSDEWTGAMLVGERGFFHRSKGRDRGGIELGEMDGNQPGSPHLTSPHSRSLLLTFTLVQTPSTPASPLSSTRLHHPFLPPTLSLPPTLTGSSKTEHTGQPSVVTFQAMSLPPSSLKRLNAIDPSIVLPHPAEDLSADDDLLSWILVDQLGALPNTRLGVHPQQVKFVGPPFKTEEVMDIVRHVSGLPPRRFLLPLHLPLFAHTVQTVIKGNIETAVQALQE